MFVFSIFFAILPQNLYFGPIIVVRGSLMQIRQRAAELWTFLGRIWSVFNPVKWKKKVWKVHFVSFSIFFAKTSHIFYLGPNIVVHCDLIQMRLRAAKIWLFDAFLTHAKLKKKVWKVQFVCFSIFFRHTTSEHFSWTKDNWTL